MTGAAVVAVMLVALMGAGAPASATESTRTVQGTYLRIDSTADWDQLANVHPGIAVFWFVDVTAEAPNPGKIEVGLSARGDLDLEFEVTGCDNPWRGGHCDSGERVVAEGLRVPGLDAVTYLTGSSSEQGIHLRVSVRVGEKAEPGQATSVDLHAHGFGDDLKLEEEPLIPSGRGVVPWALTVTVLMMGMGAALLGRKRPECP